MVPHSLPDLGPEEMDAVREVLKTGWLTAGDRTVAFEAAVADYLGVAHGVACNSGTSALFLMLLAEGIKGEVVIPSFTFVATANAVSTAGAVPVFADVDPRERMLTAATIEAALTPRTEAVMVVHYAGQCADMDPIAALCERKGLRLLEDAAETLGGTVHGKRPGAWGTAALSFFPTKNLTTGEGGMVVTDDAAVARRARALLAHGIEKDLHERMKAARPWERIAVVPGYNLRLTNLAAAIGLVQLRRLDAMDDARRAAAVRYGEALAGLPLELPVEFPGRRHVYQMYAPLVAPGIDRDALVADLVAEGIGASVHWEPACHEMPAFADRGTTDADLPVTADITSRVMSLPMFSRITPEQVDETAAALRKRLQGRGPSGVRPSPAPDQRFTT